MLINLIISIKKDYCKWGNNSGVSKTFNSLAMGIVLESLKTS